MKEWIHILRCPISHENLRLVEKTELAQFLNGFPGWNFAGSQISFEQALTNISNRYIYPVIDEIPILLADAAFDLSLPTKNTLPLSNEKKKSAGLLQHTGMGEFCLR